MFYRQQLLKEVETLAQPDYLSIIYLRLLIQLYPENVPLRLDLSFQQRKLGYFDEAIKTLQPLLGKTDALAIDAKYFIFDIQMQQLYAQASPSPEQVLKLQHEIETLLHQGSANFSAERLEKLAKFALEVGRPDVAAEFYMQLAEIIKIPSEQSSWLAMAGRWYLASEQPVKAGEMYHRAFIATQGSTAAYEYALLDIKASRAAPQEKIPFERALSYISYYPQDRELLEQATSLALSAGQFQLALTLGEQRLALDPDNIEQVIRQLELALAVSNLEAALKLARQALELQPENLDFRHRLVQIARWADQPKIVLEQLLWLAQYNPQEAETVLVDAFHLAQGLEQESLAIEALKQLSQLRRLNTQELEVLAYIFTHANNRSENITFLKKYLTRYPKQREAWRILALIQEQLGYLQDAATSWKQIEIHFGWSPEIVRRQAELLWRAGHQQEAFLLLRNSYNLISAQEAIFWEVFGDQAWTLEQYDLAWLAYQTLLKSNQINSFILERLVILAQKTNRWEEAISFAEQAFQRYGDRRLLLLGIDVAIQGKRWPEVDRLLEITKIQDEDKFQSMEFYWLLQAQIAIHYKRWPKAYQAYLQALVIDPQSIAARVGFLWLLIDQGDIKSLKKRLAQWKKDAVQNSVYWSVYAIGFVRLGQPQVALSWFSHQARRNPKDFSLLLSYADTLEQSGYSHAGWQLRQYILQQIRANSG